MLAMISSSELGTWYSYIPTVYRATVYTSTVLYIPGIYSIVPTTNLRSASGHGCLVLVNRRSHMIDQNATVEVVEEAMTRSIWLN